MVTYEELDEYLGKRTVRVAPEHIGPPTRTIVSRTGRAIIVRYNYTNVAVITPNNVVTLDTRGGWGGRKDAVKKRLNQFTVVRARGGVWFVHLANGEKVEFFDGLCVNVVTQELAVRKWPVITEITRHY